MEKKRVVIYFEHGIHSSFLLTEKDVEELLKILVANVGDWTVIEYDNDSGQRLKQVVYLRRIVTVMVMPPSAPAVQPVRMEPKLVQRSN